jgi:plastocyanin
MRTLSTTVGIAALGIFLSSCGGYGGTSGTPTAPSGNPTAPYGDPTATSDAIVVNVVAINGAQSFSPNPSSVPDGRMVVWHNVDTVTHRVVLNNGSVDTGNLDPGTFSAPMSLGSVGGYHCSIHPVMVGTVTR